MSSQEADDWTRNCRLGGGQSHGTGTRRIRGGDRDVTVTLMHLLCLVVLSYHGFSRPPPLMMAPSHSSPSDYLRVDKYVYRTHPEILKILNHH